MSEPLTARRWVLEGTWSGYTANQSRVVHRTVHERSERRLHAWASKTYAIVFTDGTCLTITARDAKPRERVAPLKGYGALINDCAHYDVASVAELVKKQDEARNKPKELHK